MNILIIGSGASARKLKFDHTSVLVLAINRMSECYAADINIAADEAAAWVHHWPRPVYSITTRGRAKRTHCAPPHALQVPASESVFKVDGAPGVFSNVLSGVFALHIACMWLHETQGGGRVILAGYDHGGKRAIDDGGDHSSLYYTAEHADALYSPFFAYEDVGITTINGSGALPFVNEDVCPAGMALDKHGLAKHLMNWLSKKYGCKKEF